MTVLGKENGGGKKAFLLDKPGRPGSAFSKPNVKILLYSSRNFSQQYVYHNFLVERERPLSGAFLSCGPGNPALS